MRLQRDQLVAGLPAELARGIAKACHQTWAYPERVAQVCKASVEKVEAALTALEGGGFLDRRTIGGSVQWTTTVEGAALAMASFAKPISRRKADDLLAGVLERVEEYNADDSKPYVIAQLRVFGSYLDPTIDPLGDLDLDVVFEPRTPEADEPEAKLDYAHQSGRSFSTFIDRLFWPQNELLQMLRSRSAYINVHVGDVEALGVECEVVYPAGWVDA